MFLTGCPREGPPTSSPAAPSPSVALQVVVVNDPPLAEAINRLRGEWAERSGGSLTATSKPWPEIAAAKTINADILIFPTRYLGELCTRDFLRPVRGNVLEAKSLNADDIFPLVRRELITWGGQVMALPLGINLPHSMPPLGNQEDGTNHGQTIAMLALAAPYAVSRDRLGTLFNPRTMEPRLSEPPFVRSLNQLLSLGENDKKLNSIESPGATEIYNASTGLWEKQSSVRRVSLLGIGDRLAAVTMSSRNGATAFKLLAWLAEPDASTQLARAGNGTMPVRKALASSPSWYDSKLSASERGDLGKVLEQSLASQACLIIPRIPGIDDYLAALDEGVKDAVAGKIESQAALEQTAAKWEKITDTLGRDAQRQAYLKHLGITEP